MILLPRPPFPCPRIDEGKQPHPSKLEQGTNPGPSTKRRRPGPKPISSPRIRLPQRPSTPQPARPGIHGFHVLPPGPDELGPGLSSRTSRKVLFILLAVLYFARDVEKGFSLLDSSSKPTQNALWRRRVSERSSPGKGDCARRPFVA